MRNPETLKVFVMADALAEKVYEWSVRMPPEERYGLTSQIRRAAVSVASNLVEGCSRESEADFRRFVEIAFGSAMELRYQLGFAGRVYPNVAPDESLSLAATQTVQSLIGFLKALRSES